MAKRQVSALGVLPHLAERPISYQEAAAIFECSPERIQYIVTKNNLPKIRRRIGQHPRLHVRLPTETIQALKGIMWRRG